LLRAALISELGRFGDEAVIAECQRRFGAFLLNPASLAPNLRTPVIQTVGRYADQASFDKLRALGQAASGTEEKLRYYYALARAQEPQFIDQNIAIALAGGISNGRFSRFLLEMALQSNDPDGVWKAVLGERAPILEKLPIGRRGDFLPVIAQASANPAIARELIALPEEQTSEGARYQAAKAAENIQEQFAFKNKLLPPLAQWLRVN
jgi:aminopeptidase N